MRVEPSSMPSVVRPCSTCCRRSSRICPSETSSSCVSAHIMAGERSHPQRDGAPGTLGAALHALSDTSRAATRVRCRPARELPRARPRGWQAMPAGPATGVGATSLEARRTPGGPAPRLQAGRDARSCPSHPTWEVDPRVPGRNERPTMPESTNHARNAPLPAPPAASEGSPCTFFPIAPDMGSRSARTWSERTTNHARNDHLSAERPAPRAPSSLRGSPCTFFPSHPTWEVDPRVPVGTNDHLCAERPTMRGTTHHARPAPTRRRCSRGRRASA